MSVFERIDQVATGRTERKEPPAPGPASQSTQSPTFFEPPKPEQKKDGAQPEQPAAKAAPTFLLDKARAEKSGKAKAFMAASSFETAISAVEMIRHHFSMTPEEKALLVASRDKNQSEWTDQEKQVNAKHAQAKAKHDKMVGKIPFDDKTMEILEHGYTLHTQITGKEADPMLVIYAAFTRALGNHLMNMFID